MSATARLFSRVFGRRETPEEWWTNHAMLLAQKMKASEVKSFKVELNAKGTYSFEVIPIKES